MAVSYTTADLFAALKRTGHIPPSQTPFTETDLLAYGDNEIQTAILRQIQSVRENYYLTYLDVPVNASGIYDVPSRATGAALADVQLLNGNSIYQVSRSEIGEQFSTDHSPTGFWTFYMKGNQCVVLPIPTTGSVRLWYYIRPNQLIPTTSAAQITAIAGAVLTVTAVPTTITTMRAVDIIQDQPHFNTLLMDSIPTNTTATQITLPSAVPSTVSVGDWVCPALQTCVPQIPVEFRPLLIQRVYVKYLEVQGYLDKMKASQAKLEAMEKDLFQLINPRVSEEPKRIVPDSNIIGGYRRWRAWRAS